MSNLDSKYAINLDLIQESKNNIMYFSLSDNETSDFFINITRNGTGINEDLADKTVTLYVVKPNNNFNFLNLSYDDSKKMYYCNLSNEFKNIKGNYMAQVVVYDSTTKEQKVTRSKFKYCVENDNLSDASGNVPVEEQENILDNIISKLTVLDNIKADKTMVGTPLVASSTNEMTDKEKIYVNTTDGNWYYYSSNDNDWMIGGIYQSNGINSFSVDSSMINDVSIDKIDFDKYSLNSKGNTKIARLTGYDTTTYLPIYNTNDSIVCVDVDLNEPINNLYFKVSEIEGQVVIMYNENIAAGNLTYTNVINNANNYFSYNSTTQICEVNIISLRKTYTNIVIAMDKDNVDIYSTSVDFSSEIPIKGLIGERQIKDNSIVLSHIKDKSILKDVNTMSTNNYFDINLCEAKYANSYDTSTKLPNWVTGTNSANLYRTIVVPIGVNGYITAKKPMATSVNRQCFYLKADGTVRTNFATNSINSDSNTYPYNVNEYTEIYEDYIKIDCAMAKSLNSEYLTLTYSYEDECLEDIVYIDYEGAYIPAWLDEKELFRRNESTDIEIVLPSKYCVVKGMQANVYYNNAVRYCDTDKLPRIRMNGKFNNYKTFGEYTASSEDTYFDALLRVYLKNTKDVALEQLIRIQPVTTTAGSGTKKVLIIGDSYTAHNIYITKLNDLFTNDSNMSVEFLGTRGTSPCNHEGRSGWRAYEYVNLATGEFGELVDNPFYNASTSTFDFSYYMTQQGYDSVDYVCINLGTNDISRSHHATTDDMITAYNQMITSIRDYNPDIKIFIGLPGSRALGDMMNKDLIDTALSATKALIEEYDNRESDGIYLMPYYLNIDPDNDFNFSSENVSDRNPNMNIKIASDKVHPSTYGYYKIADVIYSTIKYASI